MSPRLTIRRAIPADAAGTAAVLATVAAERIHSAVDQAWNEGQERAFLESLSPREAMHVATDADGTIVGLQIVDRWSPTLSSMAHVGQVGTFVLPGWRGHGVAQHLWAATLAFAREAGYRKLVVQVRASNIRANRFYRRLGFTPCGLLKHQVTIDGVDDDEVLMEMFL